MTEPVGNGWLNIIERVGNRLPDPAVLFIFGTLLVAVGAEVAVWTNWTVERTVSQTDSEFITARGVFASDGLWWWLSNLVKNFIQFPPLGIVLVGMLGIGLAERSGLLPALIVSAGLAVKEAYLIPAVLFLGIMSSMALDAGYVVLPPIAAILFMAVGRSPLLGIAASFAGVSAGFAANLFITAIDPLMAGFTTAAAQLLEPDYEVAVTCNWWFMAASTIVLTLAGWFSTVFWVAPRTREVAYHHNGQTTKNSLPSTTEKKAMKWALISFCILMVLIILAINLPAAPLNGMGDRFPRWIEATVPLLFVLFAIPGLVFGSIAGTIQNSKDFASMLGNTIADLAPYIVLAFFAAQFIAVFNYTHLGEMVALAGGAWLASLQLSVYVLLLMFVLLACVGNLFIGSMSAKYAFMAPVFVPMLMQAGVAPELTQIAYRIGDSVTNVITPFNPYMIIVLALLQKYRKEAGLGTLISLTLPYSVGFLLVWLVMLFVWVLFGVPLGPGGVY